MIETDENKKAEADSVPTVGSLPRSSPPSLQDSPSGRQDLTTFDYGPLPPEDGENVF